MRYLLIVLLLFTHLSYAQTYECEPPKGSRVDYFTANAASLDNHQFMMSKDKMSGMKPELIVTDDSVSMILGKSSEKAKETSEGKMTVLMRNDRQITFAGMVHGAPVMGSFYPRMNVLIYSQQALWANAKFQGARAVIFYSKCKDK